MTKDINENDLPSVKFEKDIKDRMNYIALEIYVKNQTEDDEIDNWIQSFQKKVEQYLTDSSKDSSFDHNKRCRHFNYLINKTISKINSLSDNFRKTAYWSKKIKDWRNGYYASNSNLKCNKFNKYYGSDEKNLGTFCEDSSFINNKLTNIQNSVHCQKIVSVMSTRKNDLINVLVQDSRGGRVTKINNECSTQFLDTIFTTFTCNSNVGRPFTSDELDSSAQHGVGEGSSEGLVSQTQLSFGSLADGSHGSITCQFTPFGSKILGYFRNKGDIPLNQDYEETAQMLSNTPNLNNMYSENMQYNLSYQTL
ncbi:PIR Superfamily Protein [Plasmodium ovale curtisi]|uniref:PIR Superfamily Protein n=1 Tax=Plasmodium ovale curtisi TaxID=864141 RepID=A0A1A8WDK3_PLAOA|nr:PIR Superfamily Protein [Plasmodium ovale curtisi]